MRYRGILTATPGPGRGGDGDKTHTPRRIGEGQ
jgi:hypothetical protein